jgi:hypothetical protein
VPAGKDSKGAAVSGRYYLYNFDFRKFRNHAETILRPVNTFSCEGICWKFRYAAETRIYLNGTIIWATIVSDGETNTYPLISSFTFDPNDEVRVSVTDINRRWFRWFRPNTGHVTLEGLEAAA